jgi:hypothetical protein
VHNFDLHAAEYLAKFVAAPLRVLTRPANSHPSWQLVGANASLASARKEEKKQQQQQQQPKKARTASRINHDVVAILDASG